MGCAVLHLVIGALWPMQENSFKGVVTLSRAALSSALLALLGLGETWPIVGRSPTVYTHTHTPKQDPLTSGHPRGPTVLGPLTPGLDP